MRPLCPKYLAAITVPAVISILVFVVVLTVTQFLVRFCFQAVFHIPGYGFLKQISDVFHAVDVALLQQLPYYCSTGIFFRATIYSCH